MAALAKRVDPLAIRKQHRPVEVRAFVAKMPGQGPVGLIDLLAHTFAVNRICFHDVDADDAVEMTGHRIARKVEGQAAGRCRGGIKRQAKSKQ